MHRRELLTLLDSHRTHFPEEAGFVDRARRFVLDHPDCFHRDLLPGHVTGSAWVVNPARDRALMLHHGKHDRWFQPGGHADGDADILRVALRETAEETGLEPDRIRLVDGTVFDLDHHVIPAQAHFPEHFHFDVRFLVEIDDRLPVPGSVESHEVLWLPLNEVPRLNNNRSTWRMLEKTRRLRTSLPL
ncbi:nucleoside triphosphate hydrolase [Thiohalorhabdus denitrificans]|uniref:8-oxo-dGTP pyrophosphatase MutT, NUDIX family n=1 Tax=Thiohalorhabdus denitrificans TaxID=381306 RepID=A0A0P9EA45_9GAMM|nr:NUDIX hydrolase [Thiohalorhabdus denitrificans]KPV39227.1 nucleoside triphosphate hydrolase [Thiohalorhabdus denitrificans]SCX75076.1 8-oxo-dGTP pyrophosphatase MutT, NUDIX family [Thiohalorhabdus denitrificans]